MINFQDTIILTTRNPEGFLNLQDLNNIVVDKSFVDASISITNVNFVTLNPVGQSYDAYGFAGQYAQTALLNI